MHESHHALVHGQRSGGVRRFAEVGRAGFFFYVRTAAVVGGVRLKIEGVIEERTLGKVGVLGRFGGVTV